jgi:hypothetical protein
VHIAVYAPHLTLIQLGINECITFTGTTVAEYRASLLSLISVAQETGDVMLLSFIPPNPTAVVSGSQAALLAVLSEAAFSSVPLLDMNLRAISYANWLARGYMFDNYHGNNLAYWDEAQYITNALQRIY